MDVPIIFCHYGNSEYLRYTFRCAKLSNPHKEIVLLGDRANKRTAEQCGVRHLFFEDFNNGDEIKLFDSVYRLVQGRLHDHIRGGQDWVKFVFKRWFFVFNFIIRNNFRSFWHFDSDNMILEDLAAHEWKFRGYDCTDQCDGICMNGYISGPEVVKGYLNKINDLFQREGFLYDQQREFDEIHPEYAFTEMRAYALYKDEDNVRSVRLNTIVDGTSFDDCICAAHGMEMEMARFGKAIKKVFLTSDGGFYCVQQGSHDRIKMNSLNLSFVPMHFFDIVMRHALRKMRGGSRRAPGINECKTLASASMPWKYRFRRYRGLITCHLRHL